MTEHKEQAPEAPKPQKQKKSLWCRIGCVSSAVIFSRVFRRQDVVLQFQINIRQSQQKHLGMKLSLPLEY